MKLRFIATLAGLALMACQPTGHAATRGQVPYFQDWETSGPSYPHIYRAFSPNGTYAVKAEVLSGMSPLTQMYAIGMNSTQLNDMKGSRVQFSASIRADGVSQPGNASNGVKLMLHVTTSAGANYYTQPPNVYGTFDFKTLGQVANVPTNATAVELYIGLENVLGTAWFDNVKIEVARPQRIPPATRPTGPVYTGHPAVSKVRGCMVADTIATDPTNAQVLGLNWRANVARFQLTNYTATDDTDAQNFTRYRNWLNGELAKLDQFIPQAHANHMYVVIDLHAPPGGGSTTGMRLFTQTNYQDELVHTWQTIATKYVNEPTVWGYDLVNEPVVGFAPTNIDGWNELATRVGLAIRAIDTTHAIIVEPEFGSDSSGFDYLTPLAGVSGVVYSPHVYNPLTYTHQGINGYPAWPATQDVPTQADLTTYTQAARNFQLDYNVNMYVGEFSVIRSAQGAQSPAQYLTNAVTLFDSYGWDWSYHAFRESQYWDLEYPNGTATTPHPTVTDRLQVIKSRFSNNQIPF